MEQMTDVIFRDAAGTDLRPSLQRTGPCDWRIVDLDDRFAQAPAELASIHDDGDDVVVSWHREIPLATRYVTAEAALDDVIRWLAQRHGGVRPVAIAHFPPPAAR